MMDVATLAVEMGVTASDLNAFVECLRVWIAKGYTLEQAIERHMAQMNRLAANCHKLPKQALAEDLYEELAA